MRKLQFITFLTLLLSFTVSAQNSRNSHNENITIYQTGKQYYDAKRYKSAINEFDKIINDDPYFFNAYFKKSYSYYNLEKYKLALQEIEKAYNVGNLDHKYFYMKGQFFDKLKMYDLALYYLDLAIKFSDDNAYYYNYRGGLYLELGNYTSAIRDYDEVLSDNPKMYSVYFNRGIAKYNLKKIEEACLDWSYAYEENESCKRYFFYKCTKVDIDGLELKTPYKQKFMQPVFQLGDESLSEFIARKLTYPKEALWNEENGMVLVKFTLTKELKITNVKVVHSVAKSLDEEAIKIIKQTEGYWNYPAKNENDSVDIDIIIPISFTIEKGGVNKQILMDSLRYQFNAGNYNNVIDISTKILKNNPFRYELFKYRDRAFNELNLKDSTYNKAWFKFLRSFDGIYLDQIQSYDKALKVYFNDVWELTDKNNASFYRLTEWNQYTRFFHGEFKDFTMDGNLYASGNYYNGYRNELFRKYFKSGNVMQEFNFINNNTLKYYRSYYENGVVKQHVDVTGFNFDLTELNDSTGNSILIEGNGEFKYSFQNYLKTDTILVVGMYKNYQKDGFWKIYINSELVAFDEYKKGKFKQGLYIENGNKTQVMQPTIGSWIFIPTELPRSETQIEDKKVDPSYFWYILRDKEFYLGKKSD